MNPFIKWVGGKRQLLSRILENLPAADQWTKERRYFEPFIGGGALFFALARDNSYISDTNAELVNCYKVIADQSKLHDLVGLLRHHAVENSKAYYKTVRDRDRTIGFSESDDVERAARFIYLNKTGFNGICRVNSKGHNNVPYGDNANPMICDVQALEPCNRLLTRTEIVHGSFDGVTSHAQKHDFVYFDPPYIPLTVTSSFTGYTKEDFSMADQHRLRQVVDQLHAAGVFVMISNSSTPMTKELYRGYTQIEVDANRAINSDGTKRHAIKELLITTYQPELRFPLVNSATNSSTH